MSQTRNQTEIRAWLLQALAKELNIEPSELKSDVPFDEYGLGSVSAVSISGDLGEYLGQDFPGTLLYEYLTVDDLSQHLAGQA